MPAYLNTERLLLRPIRAEDAQAVFSYRSLPEVALYQGWVPASAEEVAVYANKMADLPADSKEQWWQWVIINQSGQTLLGDLAFCVDAEGQQAELGVAVAPHYQGQGYATEALRALISHLFQHYGLHRIHVSIDPRNQPSVLLFERLGFRHEGLLKQSLWFKGQWCDDLLMAVLADEWPGSS